MDKDMKCHWCNRQGVEEARVVVDVEGDCELDEEGHELWFSRPVYETVWVCEEHKDIETEGDIREVE